MAIGLVKISSEQVAYILGMDEVHFLDLKRKEIAPGKLTKSIAAFANADGGELYIGIGEDTTRTQRILGRVPGHGVRQWTHPSVRAALSARPRVRIRFPSGG